MSIQTIPISVDLISKNKLKSQARLISPSKPSELFKDYQVNSPKSVDSSAEIRCYGCLITSKDCTVPCKFPNKCSFKATNSSSKD